MGKYRILQAMPGFLASPRVCIGLEFDRRRCLRKNFFYPATASKRSKVTQKIAGFSWSSAEFADDIPAYDR